MRETSGRNSAAVAELRAFGAENKADVHAVELDVQSQESADAAIASIIADQGHLDVVVHNAGHMVTGPAEAFTPEQYAAPCTTSTSWAPSASTAPPCHTCAVGAPATSCGWVPARRAAALPRTWPRTSRPRRRWTRSRSPTAPSCCGSASRPRSSCRAPSPTAPTTSRTAAPPPTVGGAAYEEFYPGLMDQVGGRLAELEPSWADVGAVADAIVDVVGSDEAPVPRAHRPLRRRCRGRERGGGPGPQRVPAPGGARRSHLAAVEERGHGDEPVPALLQPGR